jgi:hypothetical protein
LSLRAGFLRARCFCLLGGFGFWWINASPRRRIQDFALLFATLRLLFDGNEVDVVVVIAVVVVFHHAFVILIVA